MPVYLSQRELIASIKTLRHSTPDLDLRVREMVASEDIETETGNMRDSFLNVKSARTLYASITFAESSLVYRRDGAATSPTGPHRHGHRGARY